MPWFSKEKFLLPMRGIFKEMYLDTNAWSELAKRNRSSDQLDSWIKDNSGFLALSPQAAFEICRDSRLSEPLVAFMAPRRTVLLTHGNDEITGKKIFWASWYEHWYPVDFREDVACQIFIEEMQSGCFARDGEKVRAEMG